ncbi:hypothetical protein V7S43_019113 [Phytophthora oleae]|uniref:PiggyBac transposable element-derived protein domain-containing protein n=1 Tax=Phytophthora oleae TaxID=2107226 RepID=A0ABD3EPP3_9STRA
MARIRSSPRGKTVAVAAVTRDIDFWHLWRQLRAAGWKSKRPRRIQREWSYGSPDSANTFVGEDAVVMFAIESGLLEDVDASDGENEFVAAEDAAATEEATVADEEDTTEDVRPSQIDTSAQLSQKILDDLFGASSDSDIDLSQAAVAKAFDLSPSDLRAGELHRDAAASLQLLSEASGADSEVAPEDFAAAPTDRVLRPRDNVKKDVNFVPDDEDIEAYESFSSGDSGGEDFDDGGEDTVGSSATGGGEDVVSDNDAVEMDEAFVISLQVGNEALSKSAAQQRAGVLRGMVWIPATSVYEENVPAYPGLNMEDAQPTIELRSICHSPPLTFFYFLPKSLWVTINTETNRYSLQQVDRRAQGILARQVDRPRENRETLVQIRRRLKASPAYQTHEILHVIGLLIARMLCPQKRRFSAHWSMSVDGLFLLGRLANSWAVTGARTFCGTGTSWTTKLSAHATSSGSCTPLSTSCSSGFWLAGLFL